MPQPAQPYLLDEVDAEPLADDSVDDPQGLGPGDRDQWWEEPEE